MDWGNAGLRVIAAVCIGGASAIAGFISRHWIEALLKSKNSCYLPALVGTWKGSFTQQRETLEHFNIEMALKARLNVVYGTAKYRRSDKDGPWIDLKCVGGLVKDRYLSLYYENTTASKLQHGTFMFLLSGSNNKLTGKFLGIGPYTERIVSGPMVLLRPVDAT